MIVTVARKTARDTCRGNCVRGRLGPAHMLALRVNNNERELRVDEGEHIRLTERNTQGTTRKSSLETARGKGGRGKSQKQSFERKSKPITDCTRVRSLSLTPAHARSQAQSLLRRRHREYNSNSVRSSGVACLGARSERNRMLFAFKPTCS